MAHHTAAARRQRKLPSDAERRLWSHLRNRQLGLSFRRQHPIKGYIVDFYAASPKLAVECDGSQHALSLGDDARTRILNRHGISVLRFWNNEVLGNIDGVLVAIQSVCMMLAPQTPTLSLPLAGGGNPDTAVALQGLNFRPADTLR